MRISANTNIPQQKYQPAFNSWMDKFKNRQVFDILDFYQARKKENIPLEEIKKLINKKFGSLDLNIRNSSDDTLITALAKRCQWEFLETLYSFENEGILGKIDWNAVDKEGNNILMLAIKTHSQGYHSFYCETVIKFLDSLAQKNKFNMNYYNPQGKYTALTYAIKHDTHFLSRMLNAKTLDVMFKPPCDKKSPIENMIDKNLGFMFSDFVNHPSMNMNKYNIPALAELVTSGYIDDSIERVKRDQILCTLHYQMQLKIHKQVAEHYQKEGCFNLNEIDNYVEKGLVNKPLNELGENIGHFLAETFVLPDDIANVQKIYDIVKKLRENGYIFKQKDEIGRTALMIALEAENFVVAKAILEQTKAREIKFTSYPNSVESFHFIDCRYNCQEKEVRRLIDKFEPEKRAEFNKLLDDILDKES